MNQGVHDPLYSDVADCHGAPDAPVNGSLRFDGVADKLMLPCNTHHHQEGYLWLYYMSLPTPRHTHTYTQLRMTLLPALTQSLECDRPVPA